MAAKHTIADGQECCNQIHMLEQPPPPDVPRPPDAISHPHPVKLPPVPDETGSEDRPDVHPVPPPTDPGPTVI
jgi:hypothetical protein